MHFSNCQLIQVLDVKYVRVLFHLLTPGIIVTWAGGQVQPEMGPHSPALYANKHVHYLGLQRTNVLFVFFYNHSD